jgi:6-pyruvoyltetrahydropterin/6-carboxytetrahydropterin synthase
MSTISVKLHFAAGHRILGLTGAGAKCRTPHGHTFLATFTWAQSDDWPPTVEFGTVKASLRARIADRYDHCFFVDKADREMHDFLVADECKHYAFDGPPTTERIAEQLAKEARLLTQEATLLSVALDEGPENTATWTAP